MATSTGPRATLFDSQIQFRDRDGDDHGSDVLVWDGEEHSIWTDAYSALLLPGGTRVHFFGVRDRLWARVRP